MNPRLQTVADELAAAESRLRRLVAEAPAEWWPRRPDPDRWSMAECVAHLNLTGRAYLPLLRSALAEGHRLGRSSSAQYRRDPIGWFLWWMMRPPVRQRVKTTAPFVPTAGQPIGELVGDFSRLQADQVGCVREADGLPLGRLRIVSPFDSRIRYNLYSCLTILPAHQHRHLWQAEQVLEQLRNAT